MENTSLGRTIGLALLIAGGIGLVACIILLLQQNARIDQLIAVQESRDNRISSELDVLGGRLDEQSHSLSVLNNEAAELRTQITTLSRYASQSAASRDVGQESAPADLRLPPSLLASGVYTLPPDSGAIDEIDVYTIHHFTMSIEVAAIEQSIHLGVANAGFFSRPQFYFDYNNDGEVDTEMGQKAIQGLIGPWVSGVLDPDLAQRIYDRFLTSSGQAEYVSPDQIIDSGNAIVGSIWGALIAGGAEIASWITGDSSEDESALDSEQPVE